MNYQRIILVGNVTRDAERRTSQSGEVTYTAFGVGVSDGKDKTTFFSHPRLRQVGETVAE
jgi:single-stranded DNA-binding protein